MLLNTVHKIAFAREQSPPPPKKKNYGKPVPPESVIKRLIVSRRLTNEISSIHHVIPEIIN